MARVYAMLIGFVTFTGVTFHLAQYAVQYLSAASAAGWRFGIAALFMIFILIIGKKFRWNILKKNSVMYTLLGIIGVLGFNVFFFLGIKYTSPLNAALIMGTNPLITTVLAFFILKTQISKQQAIGISLALVGVSFVITKGSWDIIQTLTISIGDLLIFLGNICWALYGVLGRKYLKGSSTVETTSYTMIIGAICLIALATFTSNPQPLSNVPLYAWGSILFMAVFTTVLGYLWWNKCIELIGAGRTSLFFNFVPVVTMLFSLFTKSSVTHAQLIGTALIIIGVLSSTGISTFKKTVAV